MAAGAAALTKVASNAERVTMRRLLAREDCRSRFARRPRYRVWHRFPLLATRRSRSSRDRRRLSAAHARAGTQQSGRSRGRNPVNRRRRRDSRQFAGRELRSRCRASCDLDAVASRGCTSNLAACPAPWRKTRIDRGTMERMELLTLIIAVPGAVLAASFGGL